MPGARGAAIEFMGTEGSLLIDRLGYTYQEKFVRKPPPPPGSQDQSRVAATVEPIVRKATVSLESEHVKSFLECLRSRKTPNSEVIGGHRSALASHLGKMAYLKKQQIRFDAATEKKIV